MAEARRIVTLEDKPLTLSGTGVKAGQKAPDFNLLATDFAAMHSLYQAQDFSINIRLNDSMK